METLQGFHALDLVAHRWDVATAAGLDERLGARLGRRAAG